MKVAAILAGLVLVVLSLIAFGQRHMKEALVYLFLGVLFLVTSFTKDGEYEE